MHDITSQEDDKRDMFTLDMSLERTTQLAHVITAE